MTNNLKIEVLVSNIPEDGSFASQFPSQEYVNQQLAKKASLSPEGRLDPSHAPDYTEIPGLYEHIEDTKDEIGLSIASSLQDAKGYANQQLSTSLQTKADLVNGKIPFDQIPFSADIEEQIQINVENITAVVDQKVAQVVEQVNGVATAANSYTDTKVAENKAYVDNTIGNVIEDVERLGVSKAVTIPTYLTPEAGVAAGTGVAAGAYYNVRSTDDDAVAIEYQNVGGVPTPTGKSLPSANASAISTANGETQQDINDYNGAKWRNKAGGYDLNARVMLENGNIVRSTVAGNAVDPNVDMMGWVKPSDDARLITPYEYGAIQKSTAPVSEWYTVGSENYKGYADLAAVKVDYPHVVDGTEFIAWAALQKFFNVMSTSHGVSYNCIGQFYINKELDFTGQSPNYNYNSTCFFDATIWDKSTNGLQYVLKAQNATQFVWGGVLRGYGVGASTYSSRKTLDIFVIGAGCSYSVTSCLQASYALRWGFNFQNSSTQMKHGYLKAGYCGTSNGVVSRLTYVANTITNTGSSGNINQRSSIALSSAIPSHVEVGEALLFSETSQQGYYIHSISTDRLTVDVYPWVDPAEVSKNFYLVYGGVLSTDGGDSSVHEIGYLDSLQCGIGYWAKSLYPAKIGTFVPQYTSVGLVVGKNPTAACASGMLGQFYGEANNINVMKLTVAASSFVITNVLQEFQFSKFAAVQPVSGTGYNRANKGAMSGIAVLNQQGKAINSVAGDIYSTASAALNPTRDNTMPYIIKYRDVATLTLTDEESVAMLTGKTGYKIIAMGSGANNQPTGTWTFNPRSGSGWTVNGLTSATISGFTEPTDIVVYADYVNKNWIVKAMGLVPVKSGNKIYDPVSLTTGQRTAIDTLTVTGAVLGDKVSMAFSRDLQGVNLEGYVSAADTVSFYFENRTGGTVDLWSGTVSAKIV